MQGHHTRVCVLVQLHEQIFNFSLAPITLPHWRMQVFLDVEEELYSLQPSLYSEDVEHGFYCGFRVKPFKNELEFVLLEEPVVEKVVDEVK